MVRLAVEGLTACPDGLAGVAFTACEVFLEWLREPVLTFTLLTTFIFPPLEYVRPLYQLLPPLLRQLCPPRYVAYTFGRP